MDGKVIFVIIVVSFILLLSIIVKFKFRDNVEIVQETPKPKENTEIKKTVTSVNKKKKRK